MFSPQLSGWIKYKVYAKIKKNTLWYRLVDVWVFFPVKGGLSSKNLLKLLEATLRRFIGKHTQRSARHCQNRRFEGFWKQLGTTSGQHGFHINKSMSNIKDNKNWTWSYIKGGFAPRLLHLPHDAHGWKKKRDLAGLASNLFEVQHLLFLVTQRLGWTRF